MFWFRSSCSPSGEPASPRPRQEPPSFGSSFLHVAIDPIGPPEDTNSSASYLWLVFTCLKSRAIHLEFARPGDSASVVEAMNRFIKMWSTPEEVYFYKKHSYQAQGDNGRNRLANILPMLQAVHKFKLILDYQESIWNNFYPILIYTLSAALKSFEISQDNEKISCHVLKQIEELVNSRPILKHGNSWSILTPEHLVNGLPLGTAQPVCLKTTTELLQFWECWSLKYLCWLKEFYNLAAYVPTVGEVVLLCGVQFEAKVAFNMAVIEELIEDSNGLPVRAKISMENGQTLEQEIEHLIPLECSRCDELLNEILLPLC